MATHRAIILASYVLVGVTVFGLENQEFFASQLLALFGIAVTVSFVMSPVMVWLAVKEYFASGKSKGAAIFLLLAIVYLVIYIIGIHAIWPQLMGV